MSSDGKIFFKIMKMIKEKVPLSEISKKFKVTPFAINAVKIGRFWQWVYFGKEKIYA